MNSKKILVDGELLFECFDKFEKQNKMLNELTGSKKTSSQKFEQDHFENSSDDDLDSIKMCDKAEVFRIENKIASFSEAYKIVCKKYSRPDLLAGLDMSDQELKATGDEN